MWFFSSDPSKNFAYEIADKVTGQEDSSIWALHHGKHKAKGTAVSVFVFDIKGSSESQVQSAKAAFKKIKTLRHPNILSYVDGLESEKVLYIVTEAVTPLENYIRENSGSGQKNDLAISWGLHQVAKGLSFLINDCGFIHNNVCMSSVYVDAAGEWRLGGIDYMYTATGPESIPPVKILPALEKYDPPEKSRGGGGRKGPGEKWSIDSWGLGCLIWEIFNGHLPKTASLKTIGKMPKSIISNYGALVGADPRSRPNPSALIESCRHRGGFMDNKFVDTMLFLEEIQIKDQNEKTAFFNSLPPVLDSFPPQFCKMRILPQLLHAFEYGNAGSAVLTPLFKIGRGLEAEEYQTRIVPCIVKLFSSTDRATRVKLLEQMGEFVEYLSSDVVNGQIFPNVVQGFMDTNPVVREHTIKSMLHLAAKLNYKNLNEELLKHFARLQSKDDQGGIRTNTTVCLGKIACHLNPQIRQKCLSSAYLRALKDPFPPSRQAGILAMAATQNFFTLKESALRLLPTLCSLTMDPDKGVRDQAFKAIRCYLAKLEKVSENPELTAEMEKDVNTGGTAASNAASWAGWAVSGMSSIGSITSKIYKGKTPPPNSQRIGDLPKKQPSPTSSDSRPEPQAAKPQSPTAPISRVTPAQAPEEEEEEAGGWGNSGWDDGEADGWGDMNDASSPADSTAAPVTSSAADGWGEAEEDDVEVEDEDWGAIDDVTSPQDNILVKQDTSSPWGAADFTSDGADGTSTSSYNWGGDPNSEDFFSSLIEKKSGGQSKRPSSASSKLSSQLTTKPAAPKISSNIASKPSAAAPATSKPQAPKAAAPKMAPSKAPSGGAGWDDWGNDGGGWGGESEEQWGAIEDDKPKSGLTKAEEAKKQREERKAQRQKELEQKRAAKSATGAMKLGARKKTLD